MKNENNKKSLEKSLEKRNSTTYYTIQNVLFNFSLMFKQTFAIWWNWKKKMKENCSKMTKLKRKERTKKIWIYLLCDIRTLSQLGRGTLNRKFRLAEANAKTSDNRSFECLLFGLKILDWDSLPKVSTTSQSLFDLVYPSQFIVFPLCYY